MKPLSTNDTNLRGVPIDELCKILASVQAALTEVLRREAGDPITKKAGDLIPTWPSLVAPYGLAPGLHPRAAMHLESGLARQLIKEKNAPERFCYVRNKQTPANANKWLREAWILQNWFTFQPVDATEMRVSFEEGGLCYLTDETVSDVVSHRFDGIEFSKKQAELFRTSNGLLQVPPAHRVSGIIINGNLKIERIGRKSI